MSGEVASLLGPPPTPISLRVKVKRALGSRVTWPRDGFALGFCHVPLTHSIPIP